jgi:hypothetical protein
MRNPTEYTGVEAEIMDKMKTQDISWVPIGKALSLQSAQIVNKDE